MVKELAWFVFRQLKNLRAVISGRPLVTPSLVSTTLDRDDILLAENWLNDETHWNRLDEVDEYNSRFAAWNGSAHAFSFMGGREALSAIISALGLSPGDEVILPGYTCVVVPNAFLYAGVKPSYADIELETYGLDASKLETCITSRTSHSAAALIRSLVP